MELLVLLCGYCYSELARLITAYPVLFDPISRVENVARRGMGAMGYCGNLAPKDNEIIAREIQEIKDAL
jgi:hypothetical protein